MEDRGFELDKCSCSKRASLDSIAASRGFSFLSCAISFSSCYGFAGLRLHPLFVLHLALLVAGIPSPVEQLLLFEKASPTQPSPTTTTSATEAAMNQTPHSCGSWRLPAGREMWS